MADYPQLPAGSPLRTACKRRASNRLIVAVKLLVAMLFLLGLIYFDLQDSSMALVEWFDTQEASSLLFVPVMAIVVLLLLPGEPFTIGAGFVYGVVRGSLYVVVGTTLGATIAFLIARHLFGKSAKRYLANRVGLKSCADELGSQGWKIAFFCRLIPFFPSKLSNYFFGVTPMTLRSFVVGSSLGIIPYSLLNVYLGSIAGDVATLGRRGDRSPIEWGVYGIGFLVALGVVVYLTRVAVRAMHGYGDVDNAGGRS
jgi:uncharacterized membrane protein YdjX (TVP38/TMEM64 family)